MSNDKVEATFHGATDDELRAARAEALRYAAREIYNGVHSDDPAVNMQGIYNEGGAVWLSRLAYEFEMGER